MTQPDPRPAAAADEAARDVTLLDLVNVVLRYRRSIVLLPLLAMALGVAMSLSSPRSYRADGAFLLQGAGGEQSSVAGLAAQFGVSVPGGGSDVPQLYADLLVSRRFLGRVAGQRFEFSAAGQRHRGTLAQLLRVEGRSAAETQRKAVKLLRGAVSAKVNPITGVVGLSVTTPWPALSEQVAQRLLEMVTEFNLSTRQSQAASERRFTQARLADAARELRAAENALQDFMLSNRRFENAPQLMMRRERLARDVTEHQAVYAMLAQAYERARIDEVRDTPVLTLIEGPAGSALPLPRETLVRGILMGLLGLVLAIGLAFWREALRTSRERQAPELREFMRLKDEALGGLGRRRRAAPVS
ncbi:MAG TPA: Wzz/FepE/Etk N-terminal domain-containing protein [Longimicrobium sp.]|nr:Wzz/FepE/Etk N-terminal domain-containing protein [Longimicrobium sp.]